MEQTTQNMPPTGSVLPETPVVLSPNVAKPKYWLRRLTASAVVFVAVMGYFTYVAFEVDGRFKDTVLVGAITIALGVSIVFYFIYWLINIVWRKLGKVYAIIIWVLLIGGLVAGYFSFIHYAESKYGSLANEESLALPPGTDLSELPSYIQIDKSRIVNMPDGSMAIPKNAIKFVMSYEECLKTTDENAKKGCANKYAL